LAAPTQVGSVSAKIILDTSEFEKAIGTLRDDIDIIKNAFGEKTKGNGFADEVKKLREEIDTLKKTTEDYKNKINSLREQLSNSSKSFKDNSKEAENLKSALNDLNNVKIRPKGLEELQRALKNMTVDFKRSMAEINYHISKFDGTKGYGLSQGETFSMALRALANYRKELMSTTNIFSRFNQAQIRSWSENAKLNESWSATYNNFSKVQSRLDYITTGYNKLTNSILKTTDVLTKFNFALLEGVSKESIFYQRTVQLASAIQRLSVQGTSNWSGRQSVGGYSNYISQITEVNKKLEEQAKKTERVSKATKSGQMSMREFGTAMGSAEKYSNNLYRGLQKVRSVIVSIKTIFGAMGAMALWGFATDLIEGAKETYRVKSEMESLLAKNSKVTADPTGIETFNKALDGTIERFQKINKYSLGETVASIGLEFELNAKQMAESMDVIAMVQNEYARAGRTSEEAALAVKDILQGEFRRLSMETGIGKEDLIEKYGWSGNKEDIESLMEALRKAGKDRHWDLFAEKATSLNDVINITKNRFSEFGADLITNVEPAILAAFNAMVGGIDHLKKSFESMGSFGKIATIGGVGLGAFTGISTALMILKRNMGLAEIATLGWGKSFATALMGLNKTDVALHGFWKTLVATTSGTDAATVANIGLGKSILGRLGGVKQEIQAEHGLASALMARKIELQGNLTLEKAAIIESGNLRQKIIYLAKSEVVADKASATWGKTLKSLITSTKLLKIALLGLTTVAILGWFAGIAAQADKNKKAMENYNNLLSNGNKISEDASKKVSDLQNKLAGLTQGTKEYNDVYRQLVTAKYNKADIDHANEMIKTYEAETKAYENRIKYRRSERLNESYRLAGLNERQAGLAASGYTAQVEQAQKVRNNALKEYDDRLYKASQHINEHVSLMKEAGADEEKLVSYVTEYNAQALETAELWRKFNEGDLNSGFYAVLGELKLMWIDLWNDDHFINFWNSVNDTWNNIKPTVYAIKDALVQVGQVLLDFFATKEGQIVGGIAATGLAFGVIGTKIYHLLGGAKSTIDIIKTLGGKLKDVAGRWKDVGDKAEEANTKMGGGKKSDKSTGGINGDVSTGKNISLKESLANDAKKYARAAVAIAAGMVLITEAIVLLRAPMGALAELGWQFKQWEPDIRKGIEGLTLIAPTITALLIPVTTLAYVLERFEVGFGTIVKGSIKAAIGIAAGMLLVAETIAMIIPSLWALGELGNQYEGLESQVKKGTEAMKIVSDSLQYLLPFIPALAGGILLAIAIFESGPIGGALTLAVAGGIAIGLLLLAETVYMIQAPLWSIGQIGNNFKDLSGVRKGAEAIKLTAEALSYLTDALGAMVKIDWDLLADYVIKLIGTKLGLDFQLTSLTEEGGFFDEVNKFTKQFNEMEIVGINEDKITALNSMGTGLDGVATALKNAKTAIDNIPPELKNPSKNPLTSYNKETGQMEVSTGESETNYFDQLKEPIKQLKKFVDDFNNDPELNLGEGISQDKIDAINSASSMLEQVNNAVTRVKNVLGNIATTNVMGNVASATNGNILPIGIIGGIMGLAESVGGGQGDYQSSIGGQLYEMEMVIKDLNTFNGKIAGYTGEGGEGGDVSGLTSMVTAVSSAIGELKTTLSENVPAIKQSAIEMGQAIPNGFKEGMGQLYGVIVTPLIETMKTARNYAGTYGKGVGWQGTQGFKAEFKIKDAIQGELDTALQHMDGRKQEFYDKGYALGQSAANGFKDGDDIHSPGIMARALFGELDYMTSALDDAVMNMPNQTSALAETMATTFTPSFNLGFLDATDLSLFSQGLGEVTSMASAADMQTSLAFNDMNMNVAMNMQGMTTSVNGAFNTIQTNATTSYAQITNTTRTSLSNMQSQTTKNINAIKSSWRGMQDALIASAENIRSETSAKINALESNMASFWSKVQNPSLLLAGGSNDGSIRTRNRPSMRTSATKSTFKRSLTGAAGPRPKTGQKYTGISDKIRSRIPDMKKDTIFNHLEEYLQCLLNGGICAAGSGWGFNWSDDIKQALLTWHTHFGEIYDPYLYVGKFENDDFPVRGIAEIAKNYIYDAISRTTYSYYYDHHYGSAKEAYDAGSFNCMDGAMVAIGFANAFGFPGGVIRLGSWDGEGHGFADIPGLGIIDATAIQKGYGFTSPKVSGYGSSSLVSRSAKTTPTGQTHNYNGDINLNINVYGDDVEVNENKVDKTTARSIIDLLGINPHTGL